MYKNILFKIELSTLLPKCVMYIPSTYKDILFKIELSILPYRGANQYNGLPIWSYSMDGAGPPPPNCFAAFSMRSSSNNSCIQGKAD